MNTYIKSFILIFLASAMGFSACKKPDYAFGDMKTPTDLTLAISVARVSATNPNGNGTGAVTITTTANNAITYKVDYGNGKTEILPAGTTNFKYSSPGTFEYTVTINAIGAGGTTSTISKKVKVFVAFEIPAAILQALTNAASKTWINDNTADGHVGIGPADAFSPIWYAATPNQRDACLYDDEITFTKYGDGITMAVNSKGESSLIKDATAYYGKSGGDGCYNIATGGSKKLAFMNATSASTSANSTRIQFEVPGNGIVNFGTGGNTYEILSLSATNIHLRNIGADGNAWYQKLKVKP